MKKLLLALGVIAALSLIFVGCGEPKDETPAEETSKECVIFDPASYTGDKGTVEEVDGEKYLKITVDGYLIFEDVKDDGTTSEIMSIITPEKKVYSCQSATFKRTIKDIFSLMKGKQFTVVKTSGKNKSGRDFINCYLDTEGLL